MLPVALATAVLPTVGTVALLSMLPQVAALWPTGLSGAALAGLAIVGAVALVLLPPSVGAFAAGYVLGAGVALPVVVLAVGLAAVLGQRVVWPLLVARLYAFMRTRPRVHAVQRYCSGDWRTSTGRVAMLRWAGRFPFAVTSLLLSAAGTGALPVAVGSTLATVPLALVAGQAGSAWRSFREQGLAPTLGTSLLWLVGAATAAIVVTRARRHWLRATAP